MAKPENKNSSSNSFAVIRDIVGVVGDLKNFGQSLSQELELFEKELPENTSKEELGRFQELKEFAKEMASEVIEKGERAVRQLNDNQTLKKNRKMRAEMTEKYRNHPSMHLNLTDKSSAKEVSEVNVALDSVTVSSLEFKSVSEVLVLIDGEIEKRKVSFPKKFDGLDIKQPLTIDQFDILSTFTILDGLNQRLQRPQLYYDLKKAEKKYVDLKKQRSELIREWEKVKAKKSQDEAERLGISVEAADHRLLVEMKEQFNKVAPVELAFEAAIIETNKLQEKLKKSLPVPQDIDREAIKNELDVSTYHVDALRNGAFSIEQAKQYRSLSEDALLEIYEKIKKEEDSITLFLDYLSLLPEEQNPFNLSDDKAPVDRQQQSNDAQNEIQDDNMVVQYKPATAAQRKINYRSALEMVIPQVKHSISTAKLLCDIEMAHRHNQNNDEHRRIVKQDSKLIPVFNAARQRVERTGFRALPPTEIKALIRKVDAEERKLQKRKNSRGFRLLSSLTSEKRIWFSFVPNALIQKRVALKTQEQNLRALKKTIKAAAEKTPVIQSLLGEGILGHAQIRQRFITALQNEKYSTPGLKNNVDLKDLRAILKSKKADPVLLDAKISEFVARCNNDHLRVYFEKLIDGMIDDIKAESAKLWEITKWLSRRDSKDQKLIKHLQILKALLTAASGSVENKALKFVEIYQSPEMQPFFKSFNEEQNINKKSGFIQRPSFDEITSFQGKPSLVLFKLLRRTTDIHAENKVFKAAFLSLLGVVPSSDDTFDAEKNLSLDEEKVLRLLETQDYHGLDILMREVHKRLKRGAYRPAFTDPRTKASFEYLVKQLIASMRIGVSIRDVDTYERQKPIGDIKLVKELGHLEAESPLADLVFNHPSNPVNDQRLLDEIGRVRLILQQEKSQNQNIRNILNGLSILESFVRGTRVGLLSAVETTLLQKVLPQHRLMHTHVLDNAYAHSTLATYLVRQYIQPKFNQLDGDYQKKIIKAENVDLSASNEFERCTSHVELIKAYAFDQDYQKNNWFASRGGAVANVIDEFIRAFLSVTDISNESVNSVSGAYLRTAFDPSANIQFNFYIDAHLFGFADALSNRLQQYGFPEVTVKLSNDMTVMESLRTNNAVLAFLKNKIELLPDAVVRNLVSEPANGSVQAKKDALLQLFFTNPYFGKTLRKDGLSEEMLSKRAEFVNDLQSVFHSAINNCQNAMNDIQKLGIYLLPPHPDFDAAVFFNAQHLNRGLLIRNIGTDEQASAYLSKRLPSVVLEDRITAQDKDIIFLIHEKTRMSQKCQALIQQRIEIFVNDVTDFPADASDTTEDFIEQFASQYLATYQHKRLLSLLGALASAHHVFCNLLVKGADQAEIEAAMLALDCASSNFQSYWVSKSFNRTNSLLNSSLTNAQLLRGGIANILQGYVDDQERNQRLISLSSAGLDVRFDNYLGNYMIFAVPGQDKHAFFGKAVETLIQTGLSAKRGIVEHALVNEETLYAHIIHKLSTLLEMSFLFDKGKNDSNIITRDAFVSLNGASKLQPSGFLQREFQLESVIAYFEQLPGTLKENVIFQELFIGSALENHLVQVEKGERPLSTTAELFFRRFGTPDQCDRFRLCYVKQLLDRGESMRANANPDSFYKIDQEILGELKTLMACAPQANVNKYQPKFQASDFIRGETYRYRLDVMLQTYLDKRIIWNASTDNAVVYGVDLQENDNFNDFVDIIDELGAQSQQIASQDKSIQFTYAPINTMVWKVGEELASEDHVRNTRFDLLEEYLERSPELSMKQADEFIEQFISHPLGEMIDSKRAMDLCLAYIEAMKDGNSRKYSPEAKDAAAKLILFFAPALLNQLFYAELAQMFKTGLVTVADLAGGAVLAILKGFGLMIGGIAAALAGVAKVLLSGLAAGFAFIPTVLALLDKHLEPLATDFARWLSTNTELKEKRNFLLDYLCSGFVEDDETLQNQVDDDFIGENGTIRQLLATLTYDRLNHKNKALAPNTLREVVLGNGVRLNFDRLEKTKDELQNTFAWFCALDPVAGYYPSGFALLHLAQLCQNNVPLDKRAERIENLLWMNTYEYQFNQKGQRKLFEFQHQLEANDLFLHSPFFAAEAKYDENIAAVIEAYATPDVVDLYRLKKIRDLIEDVNLTEAEKFIKAEEFCFALISEFIVTPSGKRELSTMLERYLDTQPVWTPVVSVFAQALAQNKALKQKDNWKRFSGLIQGQPYNQYLNVALSGSEELIKRDDFQAFKFLDSKSNVAESIARSFGSNKAMGFIQLLDDLLRLHLPSHDFHDLLEALAEEQLEVDFNERRGYPEILLGELSKLENQAVIDLDLGRAIGLDVKNAASSDQAGFFFQFLQQTLPYLEIVDVDNLAQQDNALAIKLQKIRLLFDAYNHQKSLYTNRAAERHQPYASLSEEGNDFVEYTKPLNELIRALNYDGAGATYARKTQMIAEVQAQAFLSGMHEQVLNQLNASIISELAPYQATQVDANENEQKVAMFTLSNALYQASNDLSSLQYDKKGEEKLLFACEQLFNTAKDTFDFIAPFVDADAIPCTFNTLSDVSVKINQVRQLIHLEAEDRHATLSLTELSPILMLPLFDKSYGKILLHEDKLKLQTFIGNYKTALSNLLNLADNASLLERNQQIHKILESFIEMVALHVKGVDLDYLKALLMKQYVPGQKNKELPAKPEKSVVNANLEQVLRNIAVSCDSYAKKPQGEAPNFTIQQLVRNGVAQFSICGGYYRDMQKGIDNRIIKVRNDISKWAQKVSVPVSMLAVKNLQNRLQVAAQGYKLENEKNASMDKIKEIYSLLINAPSLQDTVRRFLSQIGQMKEALSADLTNKLLPCFEMDIHALKLLYGSLTQKNRETLATLIDDLLQFKSPDKVFFMTEPQKAQLKMISLMFRSGTEANGVDLAQYESDTAAIKARQSAYDYFVVLINAPPEQWNKENIMEVFSELSEIKDAQMLHLVKLQFESKLGKAGYETEKQYNPYYMVYKALQKVSRLYLDDSDISEQDIQMAVDNVEKVQKIVEKEFELKKLLAEIDKPENEGNLSGEVNEFRTQLGIITDYEKGVYYQSPFLGNNDDLNEIGRVFCGDLLTAQHTVFSHLYFCLNELNKQYVFQDQLEKLEPKISSVDIYAATFADLKQYVNDVAHATGINFDKLKESLNGIENEAEPVLRRTEPSVRAAPVQFNLSEDQKLKLAVQTVKQTFQNQMNCMVDAIADIQQRTPNIEKEFQASYRRYQEIDDVLKGIYVDNQQLSPHIVPSIHNAFQLSGLKPALNNIEPGSVYLYLDMQDKSLHYAFTDKDNTLSFALIHKKQLGSQYYDRIVSALEELRARAALSTEPANFDEETMLALSYVVPLDAYRPATWNGKWISSTSRSAGYEGVSVSASLSTFKSNTAQILMNNFVNVHDEAFHAQNENDLNKSNEHDDFMKALKEFDHSLYIADPMKSGLSGSNSGLPQDKKPAIGSYSEAGSLLGKSRKEKATPAKDIMKPKSLPSAAEKENHNINPSASNRSLYKKGGLSFVDMPKNLSILEDGLNIESEESKKVAAEAIKLLRESMQNSQANAVRNAEQPLSAQTQATLDALKAKEEEQVKVAAEEALVAAAEKAKEEAKIAEEAAKKEAEAAKQAEENAKRTEEERVALEKEKADREHEELTRQFDEKRRAEKLAEEAERKKAEQEKQKALEKKREFFAKVEESGFAFVDNDDESDTEENTEDKLKKKGKGDEEKSHTSNYHDFDDHDDDSGVGIQSNASSTTIVIPSSQPTPTPSSSQSQSGNAAQSGKQQAQSEHSMTKTPSHKAGSALIGEGKVPLPTPDSTAKKVVVSASLPQVKAVGFGADETIISNNPAEQTVKNVKLKQNFFARVAHKGRDTSSGPLIGAGRSKSEEKTESKSDKGKKSDDNNSNESKRNFSSGNNFTQFANTAPNPNKGSSRHNPFTELTGTNPFKRSCN